MSHEIGSDSQRPFAIVIVGGLIVGLVLSIYIRHTPQRIVDTGCFLARRRYPLRHHPKPCT
jgi:Cu/Ag efflux pump CusA